MITLADELRKLVHFMPRPKSAKLTLKDAKEIRKRRRRLPRGTVLMEWYAAIAAEYNVSSSAIQRVVQGRSYQE